MAPRKIPARLDVFLAPKMRKAVVLRRGPAKQVCTVGWNLSNEKFELGQWLKGRIHGYCCDLSPSGKYFVYYAVGAPAGEYKTWTAISRAPYLKPIGRWAVSAGLPGGGVFLAEDRCWLHNAWQAHQQCDDLTEEYDEQEDAFTRDWRKIPFRRLLRDGWTVEKRINHGTNLDAFTWTKAIGEQGLLKNTIEPSGLAGLGHDMFSANYQIANLITGDVQFCRDWEWADVEGSRLLWAEGGKIFSADIEAQGLGRQRCSMISTIWPSRKLKRRISFSVILSWPHIELAPSNAARRLGITFALLPKSMFRVNHGRFAAQIDHVRK